MDDQKAKPVCYGDSVGLWTVSRHISKQSHAEQLQTETAHFVGLFQKPKRAPGIPISRAGVCIPPMKDKFKDCFAVSSYIVVDPMVVPLSIALAGSCISSCRSQGSADVPSTEEPEDPARRTRPLRYDEPIFLVNQDGEVWTEDETTTTRGARILQPGLPDSARSVLVVFRRADPAKKPRKGGQKKSIDDDTCCNCACLGGPSGTQRDPATKEFELTGSRSDGDNIVREDDRVVIDVIKVLDCVAYYGLGTSSPATTIATHSVLCKRVKNFRPVRTRVTGGYLVCEGPGKQLTFQLKRVPPVESAPDEMTHVALSPINKFNLNCMNESTLFVWQVAEGIRRAAVHSKRKFSINRKGSDLDNHMEVDLNFSKKQLQSSQSFSIPNPRSRNSNTGKGGSVSMKDYAPEVFRLVRLSLQIATRDYLSAWTFTPESLPRMDTGAGRSGSLFMMSSDKRFLFKTIPANEVGTLLDLIRDYARHVTELHPRSRLMRFVGLHRFNSSSLGKDFYLVVGTNSFYTPLGYPLQQKFDLKGRKPKRKERKTKPDKGAVWKDNQIQRRFFVPLRDRISFLDDLRRDVEFLRQHHVMDYSLLVGVYNVSEMKSHSQLPSLSSRRLQAQPSSLDAINEEDQSTSAGDDNSAAADDDEVGRGHKGHDRSASDMENDDIQIVVERMRAASSNSPPAGLAATFDEKEESDIPSPSSSALSDSRHPSQLDDLDSHSVPPVVSRMQTRLDWEPGSEAGVCVLDSIPELQERYHVSVIDFLAFYGLKKKTANFFKSFLWEQEMLSTIPPDQYADRFLDYLEVIFPDPKTININAAREEIRKNALSISSPPFTPHGSTRQLDEDRAATPSPPEEKAAPTVPKVVVDADVVASDGHAGVELAAPPLPAAEDAELKTDAEAPAAVANNQHSEEAAAASQQPPSETGQEPADAASPNPNAE